MENSRIPVSGIIYLESDEGHWRALILGIIKEIKDRALIENENREVQINLIINKIMPPEDLHVRTSLEYKTDLK